MTEILDARVWQLAAVGSLLLLDRRVAVQVGASHPVVAAPIAGIVVGEPALGLLLGVLIGLLWSGAIPVGGVVPPDDTLGSLVGVGAGALGARAAGADLATSAAVGFGAALVAAWIGRWLELGLRRLNGRVALRAGRRVEAGDLAAVDRAVLICASSALAVGFVAVVALLAASIPAARAAVVGLPQAPDRIAEMTFPVPLAGLGAVIVGAGFRLGLVWATLGFLSGLFVAEVIAS